MKIHNLAIKASLFAGCALLMLAVPASLTAQQTAASDLTADQIVQRLLERNEDRARNLQHYTATRHYHLEYHGMLGARDASMDVEASFDAPATKNFRVVSETGSKIFITRVLSKLLESEKEAMAEENRRKSALSRENYKFELDGREVVDGIPYYVLKVEPRNDNKFLYRGKIWIDGHDFAVARIEAEPAKNPSFWTKKSEIHQRYAKVGEFWLPAQNKTVTTVRIGGVATLQIDYQGYEVNSSANVSQVAKPSVRSDNALAAPVNAAELTNSFAK